MDDDHIGAHCHQCKQKDWMPISCKFCKNVFCYKHEKPQQHQCKSYNYDSTRKLYKERKKQTNNQIQWYCFECQTKLYQINKFLCEDCNRFVCLKHRYKQQHNCITSPIRNNQDSDDSSSSPYCHLI